MRERLAGFEVRVARVVDCRELGAGSPAAAPESPPIGGLEIPGILFQFDCFNFLAKLGILEQLFAKLLADSLPGFHILRIMHPDAHPIIPDHFSMLTKELVFCGKDSFQNAGAGHSKQGMATRVGIISGAIQARLYTGVGHEGAISPVS